MTHPHPVPTADRNIDRRLIAAFVLVGVAVATGFAFFAFFPVLAVGAIAAVAAIIIAREALPRRRGPARAAIALAALAGAVDVVLLVIALVGVVGPVRNTVEFRASGTAFVAEFEDDSGLRVVSGSGDDWFQIYDTERDEAQITITRAPGASGPVGCAILWNDTVVVEESSDEGEVTCRYEVGMIAP